MTRGELAAKLKAKHPAYAKLTDNELVERTLAKYPQYAKQLDESGADEAGLLGTAKDVALGALKRAGKTAQGAGRLVNEATKVFGPGGRVGVADAIMPGAIDQDLEELKPTNTAQRAGGVAEQVAEFAAGGVAGAGRKGLAKLAELAARGGTIGAAQSGEVGGEAATAAALNALAPGAAKLIGKGGRKVAEKLMSSALGGAKPGAAAAALDEGLAALTRSGLAGKVSAAGTEAAVAVREAVKGATTPSVALARAAKPIEEALEKALNVGDDALAKQLTGIRDALANEALAVGGDVVKVARAAKLSPKEALELGRSLERYGGKQFTAAASKARAGAGRALREGAEAAVPGLDALNAKLAALSSAGGSLARSMKPGSATKQALAIANALSGGVAGPIRSALLESAGAKTYGAKLADLIARLSTRSRGAGAAGLMGER